MHSIASRLLARLSAALGSFSFSRGRAAVCLAGAAVVLAACGGGGGGGAPAPANVAPVARPGDAQTVLPGATVNLNGSASSDANGDSLTYSWALSSKPSNSAATLTGASTATPSFVADRAGSYVVTLTVSDGQLSSAAATVTIVANTPPTASAQISNAGPVLPGTAINLTGAATDADGDSLSYQWSVSNKPSNSTATLSGASTASAQFTPDRAGNYSFSFVANDGKVNSSPASVNLVVNTPPVAQISPSSTTAQVGVSVSLSGAGSSDADGNTLSYAWSVSSKPAGSSAVFTAATSAQTGLTVDKPGTYTVSLQVGDGVATHTANANVVASYGPPAAPSPSVTPGQGLVTQVFSFSASAVDPAGLPVTYAWNFGDGTSATGASTTHQYSAIGEYNATVTATNSAGLSSTGTVKVMVVSTVVGTLSVDCTGSNCGASSPTAYSGTGVGVWRYKNSNASPATVNVDISNVGAGKTVSLQLSNGTTQAANSSSSWGTLGASATAMRKTGSMSSAMRAHVHTLDQHDHAHRPLLLRNKALLTEVRRGAAKRLAPSLRPPVQPAPATAVGATRTWKDLYASTSSPTLYPSTAKSVCATANGRNAVFWADTTAFNSGVITQAQIDALATSFCGTNGGLARLMTVMGDVWGNHGYSNLISDTTKQEVHVSIVNDTGDAGWAGYFYGYNNFLASSLPNSNEALVFFIKAKYLPTSGRFVASALIHEAAHMINFYQRYVERGNDHDTWLEETSAMMVEDVVSPNVVKNADNSAYNPMVGRVAQYMDSGGAVDYVGWTSLSGEHYGLGGAFGAFLNRRYGAALSTQLVTNTTHCSGNSGYSCMDNLIKAAGGPGFDVEYGRFASTIFGTLPATGNPAGFGIPAATVGSDNFLAIDVFNLRSNLPPLPPTGPADKFLATSHLYRIDTQSVLGNYQRSGIIVPPGVTLQVVIR